VYGLTGAMDLISRIVRGSVDRGFQLAVGLQLAQRYAQSSNADRLAAYQTARITAERRLHNPSML
jgi:hypothetical protein